MFLFNSEFIEFQVVSINLRKRHFLLLKRGRLTEKYLPFIFFDLPSPLEHCIYFLSHNANTLIHLLSLNLSCQIIIVFRACTLSNFPIFHDRCRDFVLSQREQPTPVLRASYYTVFRGEPSVLGRPGRKVMRICTTLISSCRQNEALLRYRFRVCKPVDRASSKEDPLSRHYASKPGLPVCSVASNSVL